MLPDPTPQKACQNRFRRELTEWSSCVRANISCLYIRMVSLLLDVGSVPRLRRPGLMPLQGDAPRSPDRRNLEDGGT